MARPKKFDYDSKEFYNRVSTLAMQGMTDAEIAANMSDKDGCSLNANTFSSMKNGNYAGWTESENKRRSEKLCEVLARARDLINAIVRAAYLKGALGGKKIKSRTVVTRKLRINGQYTDDEEIQTSETESELPPNIQALATWLYHHDEEWRKVQRGEEPDDEMAVDGGISIDKWIKDNTE